ncbi:hypothetical protein OAQ34_08975 [Opitutales bacterium]|nr:hypothetical protein [Opitutales bacterium]
MINKKPNIQIKHTGASINADGAPLEFKIRSFAGGGMILLYLNNNSCPPVNALPSRSYPTS